MPTIAEYFDGLVELSQRMLDHPCEVCEGSGQMLDYDPGVAQCFLCNGSGKLTRIGGDRDCGVCGGLGERKELVPVERPCGFCDGQGTVRHARWDPRVLAHVLPAVLGSMHASREREEFEAMHQALDWAISFCLEGAGEALKNPEGLAAYQEMLERGGKLQPSDRGAKLSGAPLTPEELRKLGIEPD